jgi:hypothetical protein
MLAKLDEDIEKETEKMGIVMRRLGEESILLSHTDRKSKDQQQKMLEL